MIGITKTDTARDCWCITYNERSRIANETFAMFNIHADEEDSHAHSHKDLSKSRIERDESDLKKIELQLRQFGVFTHDQQELVCISTNDVAETDTTQSMLNFPFREEETGSHILFKNIFVQEK